MAEPVKSKFDKRVFFPPGKQRLFLSTARESLKLSWSQFAEKVGAHKRTLNDWRREKYSTPLKIVLKISRLTNTEVPKDMKIREPFWYVRKGAKIGAKLGTITCLRKYGRIGGDPEYRKKKWYEWWEREGKYKYDFIGTCKSIRKPNYSKNLAEFVGIMIGDGGITKYQVTVSLNSRTDKPYIIFVANLIRKLFGVKPRFYKKRGLEMSITVSRTSLVLFCKSIGLKIGNKLKQNLDIPEWIMKRSSFRISCMRGLMDTDGCFFNECHKINKKIYCYPRLAFSSNSKQLRSSVIKILKGLNLSPRIRSKRNVQLENKEDIVKYFDLIGTSNPKHKRKFKSAFGGVRSGYPKRS